MKIILLGRCTCCTYPESKTIEFEYKNASEVCITIDCNQIVVSKEELERVSSIHGKCPKCETKLKQVEGKKSFVVEFNANDFPDEDEI